MSLRDAINDVMEFHEKFGIPIRMSPEIPPPVERQLRYDLEDEEHDELWEAWKDDNLVEIADALADKIYIAIGTALSYGIPLGDVWDEVHRSNMAKEGGGKRGDGKIQKPKGWVPPDVKGCLVRYGFTD